MIIKMLIQGLVTVASFMLSSFMGAMPQADINSYLIDIVTSMATIFTQANNFIHFIAGDAVNIILPLLVPLLTYQYIVYPIFTFIRSIFVNGNN